MPNAAEMGIMRLPGGPSADLYVDRCTSLLCRSAVWSYSVHHKWHNSMGQLVAGNWGAFCGGATTTP